ncbi:MAG TPA: slipin family protein [Fimbriimonas sp.]|nr:slipin family protein [Fimbriimonas sp.]
MFFTRTYTVYPYQEGLLYRDGVFQRTLGAGKYRFRGRSWELNIVDLRPRFNVVPGQEILTKDLLPVKLSIVCSYLLTDSKLFHESSYSPEHEIYLQVQLVMREVVAEFDLDDCLTKVDALSEAVRAKSVEIFPRYGLELTDVSVRDIMIPPQLKKASLAVMVAQKEALASLEKARGEAASLRTLLNAANLIKDYPELLQLRTLQALETGKSGSAIIDFTKKS